MPIQNINVDDSRLQELTHWFSEQLPKIAQQAGLVETTVNHLQPSSSDASFRRYFRWSDQKKGLVLMDAPPPNEDCRPFVKVAKLLEQAGLNVPKVWAQDLERGFLALSDLGQYTWLEILSEENADELFSLAIDALISLQKIPAETAQLPAYDEALLRRELALFPEWYVKHELQLEMTEQQQYLWAQACDVLVENALRQSQVFVHRDYMPRNLMLSEPNPGILDFQDAVHGPISYDVISLFKDAFMSWPEERVQRWLKQYWDKARAHGLAVPDTLDEFLYDCDLMGAQRHLKVIGIFARINYRDGKPRYLADTPRFFNYLQQVIERQSALAPLAQLLASFSGEE
ncbi:phosphotransferase [Denitrificimonas sp. JX-1]|uniref:Phosphotransferase n=1 Tax=Denitrificimonas halotolerans TaxID=3098930 RepID=A0ABU5GSE3_9GAMM|nr:phosphotransferase [Denitrificimonas sp. JX-1]MDY7219908.1 phosphotransferase [Denitrificimonas sp. JX-1]